MKVSKEQIIKKIDSLLSYGIYIMEEDYFGIEDRVLFIDGIRVSKGTEIFKPSITIKWEEIDLDKKEIEFIFNYLDVKLREEKEKNNKLKKSKVLNYIHSEEIHSPLDNHRIKSMEVFRESFNDLENE